MGSKKESRLQTWSDLVCSKPELVKLPVPHPALYSPTQSFQGAATCLTVPRPVPRPRPTLGRSVFAEQPGPGFEFLPTTDSNGRSDSQVVSSQNWQTKVDVRAATLHHTVPGMNSLLFLYVCHKYSFRHFVYVMCLVAMIRKIEKLYYNSADLLHLASTQHAIQCCFLRVCDRQRIDTFDLDPHLRIGAVVRSYTSCQCRAFVIISRTYRVEASISQGPCRLWTG